MSNPRHLIVGVLLAAGAGSRFGGNKLLAVLPDGRTVGESACAALRPAVDRLIAIVRPEAQQLQERLTAAGAEIKIFAGAEQGMGASLAFGVGCAPEADGWLIALADMPFVGSNDAKNITDALRAGAGIVLPELQGRHGHPVGFAHRFAAELMSLQGDNGARSIIARHPEQISTVPVADHGSWFDIDTVGDHAAACAAFRPPEKP